jgi:Fe-S cluster assembly protein SufD
MGLPVRRDEYWRFTNPDSLTRAEPFRRPDGRRRRPAFAEAGALRLVFVDGRFEPSESDAPSLAGVEIERLPSAASLDLHWAQGLYGTLEEAGQFPVPRPLAALNTATAEEGVLIRVTAPGGTPRAPRLPSRINNLRRDPPPSGEARAWGEPDAAGKRARRARLNAVMEVEVAEGASFHHVRTQGRDRERRAVTHVFARVAEGGDFRSFTLTFNGVLTRNEMVVHLAATAPWPMSRGPRWATATSTTTTPSSSPTMPSPARAGR